MLSGMVRVKVSAVLAVGYFEILGGYIVTAFSSSGSAMAIAPDWGRGFGLIEAYTTASGSSAIGVVTNQRLRSSPWRFVFSGFSPPFVATLSHRLYPVFPSLALFGFHISKIKG